MRMRILRRFCRVLYGFLAATGLITVLVVCTPVVSWWAHTYSGPIDQPKGDVLIILSAASDDQGMISYSSYWRARAALDAWHTGGFKKLVISGGGGRGIFDFLTAYGIQPGVILVDPRPFSTRENAVDTAQLIRGMPGRRVLLTSDFHMYRAIRAFRKAGIAVTPLAVPDVLHSTEHWNGRFRAFETMLVESVKILYYRFRGWI